MCDVVGCEVGANEITPLAQELWSQNTLSWADVRNFAAAYTDVLW